MGYIPMPEIDKIYTFSHNEQTYYVLISYWYNQAYFEIVAIQNGDFIPHSEFYPKQFQDNIKDGCVEFYVGQIRMLTLNLIHKP